MGFVADDNIKNFAEFLVLDWGIDEKKAMQIAKSTSLRDTKKLQQRMNKLDSEYGFSKDKYIEIASYSPRLLNITFDGTKDRESELGKAYGISKAEFSRLIQTKKGVSVLLCSMEKIQDYYKWLNKSLGINEAEFLRCIMSNASIFTYNVDTIKANQNYLMERFGLTSDACKKMWLCGSGIFTQKREVSNTKSKNIKEELKLSDEEFIKLLSLQPTILNCGEEPIKNYNILISYGVSRDLILSRPRVLVSPNSKLEFKYVLAKNAGLEDKTFLGGAFMNNEEQTYARYKYLKDNNINHLKHIYFGEDRFLQMLGANGVNTQIYNTKYLRENIKLTKKIKEQLIKEYASFRASEEE